MFLPATLSIAGTGYTVAVSRTLIQGRGVVVLGLWPRKIRAPAPFRLRHCIIQKKLTFHPLDIGQQNRSCRRKSHSTVCRCVLPQSTHGGLKPAITADDYPADGQWGPNIQHHCRPQRTNPLQQWRWGPQLIAQDGRDRGDRSPVIEGVVRHLQPAPPVPEPMAKIR